jgi:hypothetical protein
MLGGKDEALFGDCQGSVSVLWAVELIGETSTETEWPMTAVLMLILAYLLGSIPMAIIAARLRRGIDIRKEGSGNAGATNAARVLGLRVGIAVALIDLAKGLLSVFLVARIAPVADGGSPALCGIAAVTGTSGHLPRHVCAQDLRLAAITGPSRFGM